MRHLELCDTLLMLVFGVIALAKGEFKITGKRMVKGSISRTLGVFLIIGAGIPLLIADYGAVIQLVLLVVVVVVGLVTSEKIETISAGNQESVEDSE